MIIPEGNGWVLSFTNPIFYVITSHQNHDIGATLSKLMSPLPHMYRESSTKLIPAVYDVRKQGYLGKNPVYTW